MTENGGPSAEQSPQVTQPKGVALVDLLDRVLATGVVVSGELTLSIADVDLVYVSLRALISSVRSGGSPLEEGIEPA